MTKILTNNFVDVSFFTQVFALFVLQILLSLFS